MPKPGGGSTTGKTRMEGEAIAPVGAHINGRKEKGMSEQDAALGTVQKVEETILGRDIGTVGKLMEVLKGLDPSTKVAVDAVCVFDGKLWRSYRPPTAVLEGSSSLFLMDGARCPGKWR